MEQREIKFRAWVNEGVNGLEGSMVYPEKDDTDYNMISNGSSFSVLWDLTEYLDEDSFVIMQYTGLKDKNGKEVYQGDVFKVTSDNDGREYITGFVFDMISGISPTNKELLYDMSLYDYGIRSDNAKIIGNIYENPELIEV